MKKIEDLNYYELLEVSPTSSAQEIHRAYERARRTYEPNSIALYSLFTAEESAAIHQRIEEAYRTLVYEETRKRYDNLLRGHDELPPVPPVPAAQPQAYAPRQTQSTMALPTENRYLAAAEKQTASEVESAQRETAPVSPFIGEFTGPAIKALREQHNMDLRYVADKTKVSARYFELIEAENFAKLPVRTYLRGFLQLYAKALGCDPERMAADYLKRYEAAMKPQKPK